MNSELATILSQNPRYAAAYHEFLEVHKNGYGQNSTAEELAEFEKFFARDFLNGIKKDSNERGGVAYNFESTKKVYHRCNYCAILRNGDYRVPERVCFG